MTTEEQTPAGHEVGFIEYRRRVERQTTHGPTTTRTRGGERHPRDRAVVIDLVKAGS
jgi:hypothetical protein